MILFFGTRPGKTEIKKLPGVTCPHCNQKTTLNASTSASYFHMFWIKLFKISKHVILEAPVKKYLQKPGEYSSLSVPCPASRMQGRSLS